MTPVLQKRLPQMPWMAPATARLPGIQPVAPGDWLRVDEAFEGQMAERDRLIAQSPERVHGLMPAAAPAAQELLDRVLAELPSLGDYIVGRGAVIRPDGVAVALDRAAPLLTLGRLVQEDFCIHTREGAEHAMTGAILCFPASWTLAQKLGRPLTRIHSPVAVYDAGLAARVQRMFDAVRVDQPLWRANALLYEDPALHQPRLEAERRPKPAARTYLRSERQCLVRLERTQAVVFSIHTTIVHVDDVDPDALAAFRALHP
jgi:dimethylamine monooxygenase subunit A